jgi:phage terminase large subunit
MNLSEYQPRPFADKLHRRSKRWVVMVLHRRAGKTVSCIAELIVGALATALPNPQFAYLAPYRSQAKAVAWQYLKDMSRELWAKPPNESELTVYIKSKGGTAKIFVGGTDNMDSLRGLYFDGVVLDEVGDMPPGVYYSVVRPALSDRGGWCVFAGTPKGKNLFWNLREEARLNPATHELIEVKASESGIIDPAELRDAKAQMTEDAYLREFEVSFDAAIPGAYWARDIGKAYDEGRIKEFDIDPELEVEVVGDLGFTDSCSWWVWQTGPEGYRVIDFMESNSQPIQYYIDWIKGLPYKVGQVWLPHDARAKSLQTGRSMIEQFLEQGIRPQLVPSLSLEDGIEAARQVLPYCYFQEEATYTGVGHLRAYSRDWDDKNQVFRNKPKHDSHSHASDAFRYLAIATKKIAPITSKFHKIDPNNQPLVVDSPKYQVCLEDLWDTAPSKSGRIG